MDNKTETSTNAPRPLSSYLFNQEDETEETGSGLTPASLPAFAVRTSASGIGPEPARRPLPNIRPIRRIDYPLYDTESPSELSQLLENSKNKEVVENKKILEISTQTKDSIRPADLSRPAENIILGAPFPLEDRGADTVFPIFRHYLEVIQRRKPFSFHSFAAGNNIKEDENSKNTQNNKNWNTGQLSQILSALPAGAQEPFREFLRSLRVE